MKYHVQIDEILRRIVEVEAEDRADALDKVVKQYENGEIVLGPDDYIGETAFDCFETEPNYMELNEDELLTQYDEEQTIVLKDVFGEDVNLDDIKHLFFEAGKRQKTRNANGNHLGHHGTSICAMLMALTEEGYLEEKWQGRRADTMDWLSAILGIDITQDKHFLDYYCEHRTAKPYLRMIEEYRKLVVDTLGKKK